MAVHYRSRFAVIEPLHQCPCVEISAIYIGHYFLLLRGRFLFFDAIAIFLIRLFLVGLAWLFVLPIPCLLGRLLLGPPFSGQRLSSRSFSHDLGFISTDCVAGALSSKVLLLQEGFRVLTQALSADLNMLCLTLKGRNFPLTEGCTSNIFGPNFAQSTT